MKGRMRQCIFIFHAIKSTMKFLLLIFSFCLPLSVLKSQTSNKVIDTTISFKVFGVCEQCKDRIENGVKGKGVKAADWNVDTKMLTLTYEPARVTIDKLHNRIVAVGHDTYLKKANNTVYNQLPDCCHYREIESMNELNAQHLDTLFTAIQKDTSSSLTHHDIRGIVLEVDNKGSFKPLMGASISWLGTSIGAITDSLGTFTIPHTSRSERLIVSYAGYQADTLTVLPTQNVKIVLGKGKQLKEVRVTASRPSTSVKSSDPFRVSTMNTKELFKAACCNLSESFETNPSVDVSYNDAISGSKQIQLLGLSGIYTQLTVENLPGPRGLATSLGLNSIPGPWIESIQLSKGTGSVANGFESIAGQINVELKKPATSERLYANVYTNDFGKTDLNLNLSQKIGKKWSTEILLHDDFLHNNHLDENKDGFRDLPTGNLFTLANKWGFDNNKGLMSQFGFRILTDERTGGQVNFDVSKDKFTTNSYGLGINTKRYEAFGKLGYVFPQKKYKSIGLQVSAFDHTQNSFFGFTNYDAHQ